jgi:hypothetical protein
MEEPLTLKASEWQNKTFSLFMWNINSWALMMHISCGHLVVTSCSLVNGL